jgi:hypothetical protein
MRKFALISSLFLVALILPQASRAQDESKPAAAPKAQPAPPNFYHLVFVVEELGTDNKVINSRTYTTTVDTDSRNPPVSIRTGSKVPVATGSYSTGDSKALVNTQFQYVDVGVDFDIRNVIEVRDQLSLQLTAAISSMANTAVISNEHEPIIRQNKWEAPVLIPIGKPTVVFTSDSLDSKGSMHVTVTATPIQ